VVRQVWLSPEPVQPKIAKFVPRNPPFRFLSSNGLLGLGSRLLLLELLFPRGDLLVEVLVVALGQNLLGLLLWPVLLLLLGRLLNGGSGLGLTVQGLALLPDVGLLGLGVPVGDDLGVVEPELVGLVDGKGGRLGALEVERAHVVPFLGDKALDQVLDDLVGVGSNLLGVPACVTDLDRSVGGGAQLNKVSVLSFISQWFLEQLHIPKQEPSRWPS